MRRLACAALIAALALLGRPMPGHAQSQAGPLGQEPVPPQARPDPQAKAGTAQDSPRPDSHRFSFYRLNDTFMRLDLVTGQMAQCGWGPAGWACNAVPDDRAALEGEIARLQAENAALKKSLLARGLELPHGVKPESAPIARAPEKVEPAPEAGPRLPSDAELDRVMAFMEKVWRRLIDMMVSLQRDIQRKG